MRDVVLNRCTFVPTWLRSLSVKLGPPTVQVAPKLTIGNVPTLISMPHLHWSQWRSKRLLWALSQCRVGNERKVNTTYAMTRNVFVKVPPSNSPSILLHFPISFYISRCEIMERVRKSLLVTLFKPNEYLHQERVGPHAWSKDWVFWRWLG